MYKPRWHELMRTARSVHRLLRHKHILGFSVGSAIRGGESQEQIAIRMYVSKKRPRSKVTGGALLPTRLAVVMPDGARDRSRWIVTDVEEVGAILAATGDVSGGDAVSVANKITGCVGVAFVNQVDRARYALTCGHVLARPGAVQIATTAGAVQADGVFRLALDSSATRPTAHNIDGALARISASRGDSDLMVNGIGKRITGLAEPGAADQMQLFSRVAGKVVSAKSLTSSETIDRQGLFKVEFPDGAQHYLTDGFAVIIDAAQGDSGSLIVRDGVRGGVTALGMLAAVDKRGRSYFQSIKRVLGQFGQTDATPRLSLGLDGDS